MELQWPKPWPHQSQIINDPHERIIALLGRRAGKTQAACQRMARAALLKPGEYWWLGPDSTQVGVAQRFFAKLIGKATRWEASKETFWFQNGSRIVLKSALSEDRLRGDGLMGLVIDEAAFIKGYLWYDVLSPALEDNRGWCLFCTTPNGYNWFQQLYLNTRNDPDWSLHEYPSWASPKIDRARLEKQLAWKTQASFDQEFGGRFTAPAGCIFPGHWFDQILIPQLPPGPFATTRLAVDPSSGLDVKNRDWQALVYLAHEAANDLWYADFRLAKVNLSDFYKGIVDLYQQYYPQMVIVESAFQQIYLTEDMAAAFGDASPPIFPYDQRWQGKKPQRINRLSALLKCERGSVGKLRVLDSPGGREAIRQMRNYVGETPNKSSHDDAQDVLEMAWRSTYLPMTQWLDPRPTEKKETGWF